MKQPNPLFEPLACLACGASLSAREQALRCTNCAKEYPLVDGIPIMLSGASADPTFDYLTHYTRDSEHFDYFEERRGAPKHSERRTREYTLSQLPKSAKTILDVGCGSGWIAKTFQHSGKTVYSLDVSIVNPREAGRRYHFATHQPVVADTYRLPFQDNSLDAVIAAEIIEHLHDPQAFADEVLRVLRPGGSAVISTPYRERLVYEVCIHCHGITPRNAHLHSWTKESLRGLFRGKAKAEVMTFNNKLLVFARTYPILTFLPFTAWKAVDALANVIYKRPINCVVRVTK